MSTRRLNDPAICAAYEKWNGTKETVDDFCERIGICKQSLYLVLRRNDVTPKSKRGVAGSTHQILAEILLVVNRLLEVCEERPDPAVTEPLRRLVDSARSVNGSLVTAHG